MGGMKRGARVLNMGVFPRASRARVPSFLGVPRGQVLRVAVSGDPYEIPGRSDFLLRLGVYGGGKLLWLGGDEVVDAGDAPSERNWRTVEAPIPAELAGQTVGLVVQVSYGGPKKIGNEEAFIDRIEVVGGEGR